MAAHQLLAGQAQAQADEMLKAEDVELQPQYVELPSMPEPDHQLRNTQAVSGAACVLTAVALCVGLTNGVALRIGNPFSVTGVYVVAAAIWTEAALALICLVLIMFLDPGRVLRSPEACSPLPEVPSRPPRAPRL